MRAQTPAKPARPDAPASLLRASVLQVKLFDAVELQDCRAFIDAALAAGASPHARDTYRQTPLHLAARNNADAVGVSTAIPALVAAGGDVHSKDSDGNEPLHSAAQHNTDPDAAAAAAVALLAAGADPHAPNGQGKPPLALALEREDAASCAQLLSALLGEAADGGSGDGDAAGGSSGAADGAGPSNGSQVQQVLRLAAAAVSQMAKGKRPAKPASQPAAPDCPVCMEPGSACMVGTCGHLVCEACAEQPQVRRTLLVVCDRSCSVGLSACCCGMHCGPATAVKQGCGQATSHCSQTPPPAVPLLCGAGAAAVPGVPQAAA